MSDTSTKIWSLIDLPQRECPGVAQAVALLDDAAFSGGHSSELSWVPCPCDRIECPWCAAMIPSCSLQEHLDVVCRTAPHPCMHKGCSMEVSRQDISEHRLKECEGFTVICYSCRETVIYKHLAAHMAAHVAKYAKPVDCCPMVLDGCQFQPTDAAVATACVASTDGGSVATPTTRKTAESISIGAHMEQCPYWNTVCTGCGAVVRRSVSNAQLTTAVLERGHARRCW